MSRILYSAAIYCFIGTVAASAVTYDLTANWSVASNPNGPWSYYQGSTPLPLVPDWTAAGTGWAPTCNQAAWAPSNTAGSFIPAWMQINACAAPFFPVDPNNAPALNVLAGDVVIHTTDSANGNLALGSGNIVFTLPASGGAGLYAITGAFWDARLGAAGTRPQDWQVQVNGAVIASGTVVTATSRSKSQVFSVLQSLNVGDKVQLTIARNTASAYGDFVGAQLKIATAIPAISTNGVVSASAFGQFPSIAPGSWIEIYGANFATHSRSWGGTDFNGVNAPTALDGTSVTVGGQPAFIDYISAGQVNAQVPSTVTAGQQPVVVTTAVGSSSPYLVTVNATQPGLLAPASFIAGGKQYTAALFSDGTTFVLPPGSIAGVTSRQAKAGDSITFYGVGFGPVSPSILAGQVVQQSNALSLNIHLFFGQTEATLTYAGLAPSAVGLYQFNAIVPSVAASNALPLTFTLNGLPGSQMLYTAVQ